MLWCQQVRVMLCDHVANLGYVERLLDRKVRPSVAATTARLSVGNAATTTLLSLALLLAFP